MTPQPLTAPANTWQENASDPVVTALKDAFKHYKKSTYEGQLRLAAAAGGVATRFGNEMAKSIIQNCLRVKGQTAEQYLKWGNYYNEVPDADMWLALGAKAMNLLVTAEPTIRRQVIDDVREMSRFNAEKHGDRTVSECYVSTKLTNYGDHNAAMANRCSSKKTRKRLNGKDVVSRKEEEEEEETLAVEAGDVAPSESEMVAALRDIRDAYVREPLLFEHELDYRTVELLKNLD